MNCSSTATIPSRYVLTENLGATLFLATYIGLYGMGFIVYFACQFVTDARNNREDEIPSQFFSIFHQINERQEIYDKLSNKAWLEEMYNMYYANEPNKSQLVERKASHCSEKYQKKLESLQSRHTYYITEDLITPTLTTISCTD